MIVAACDSAEDWREATLDCSKAIVAIRSTSFTIIVPLALEEMYSVPLSDLIEPSGDEEDGANAVTHAAHMSVSSSSSMPVYWR